MSWEWTLLMQCMWGTIVGEEGWLQESDAGPHQLPVMPTETKYCMREDHRKGYARWLEPSA